MHFYLLDAATYPSLNDVSIGALSGETILQRNEVCQFFASVMPVLNNCIGVINQYGLTFIRLPPPRTLLMHKLFCFLPVMTFAIFGCVVAPVSQAQDLGVARLFSNDFLGDGQDRWHTSSYVVSAMRGPALGGKAPQTFGTLFEHRFRSEAIAPANLASPAADDRLYAGVVSYGVHSHARSETLEQRIGVDAVVVGPQTGVESLHSWLHDAIGAPTSDGIVQLPNAIYPTVSGEVAMPLRAGGIRIRPFAEAQFGVENFARVGADFFLSDFEPSGLRLRDVTTGQLYTAPSKGHGRSGMEFVLGADVARVWSSHYLSGTDGNVTEPVRWRGRAGVQINAPQADVFYGVTWLTPEFEAQPEGQLVGSLNVNLRF